MASHQELARRLAERARAEGLSLTGPGGLLERLTKVVLESAKAWMAILAELRNRGIEDVCIVACDGLKGLPEAIGEIWPAATVQLCVVHLVRDSLRYASKKYWSQLAKDLQPPWPYSPGVAPDHMWNGYFTKNQFSGLRASVGLCGVTPLRLFTISVRVYTLFGCHKTGSW